MLQWHAVKNSDPGRTGKELVQALCEKNRLIGSSVTRCGDFALLRRFFHTTHLVTLIGRQLNIKPKGVALKNITALNNYGHNSVN